MVKISELCLDRRMDGYEKERIRRDTKSVLLMLLPGAFALVVSAVLAWLVNFGW